MKRRIGKHTKGRIMGLVKRNLVYEAPHENSWGVYRIKNVPVLCDLILKRLCISGKAADHFRPTLAKIFASKLEGVRRTDVPALVNQIWETYSTFVLNILALTRPKGAR
jgi:hypothetical protein